jgi:hypothetical protein
MKTKAEQEAIKMLQYARHSLAGILDCIDATIITLKKSTTTKKSSRASPHRRRKGTK